VVTSHGSHGLVRSLPIAAFAGLNAPNDVARLAFESCALTHADPFAMHATLATVICLGHMLRTGSELDEALQVALHIMDGNAPPVVTDRFRAVAHARTSNPGSLSQLGGFAPDRSALSVAAAALYAFGQEVDEDIESYAAQPATSPQRVPSWLPSTESRTGRSPWTRRPWRGWRLRGPWRFSVVTSRLR